MFSCAGRRAVGTPSAFRELSAVYSLRNAIAASFFAAMRAGM